MCDFATRLGDRVETDDAANERLVELEVLILRAIPVHNTLQASYFSFGFFVPGVEEREVN